MAWSAIVAPLLIVMANACLDITPDPNTANATSPDVGLACAHHLLWAKNTGIVSQPQDYYPYKNLTAADTWGDFQCVLRLMKGVNPGLSHNCPMPCTSTMARCAQVAVTTAAAEESSSSSSSASSSMPWWAWLLLALLLCAAIAAAALFYVQQKNLQALQHLQAMDDKPKKKKRGVEKPAAKKEETKTLIKKEEAPAPAGNVVATYTSPVVQMAQAMPAPQSFIAVPQAQYVPVPTAVPVTYAAPEAAVTYAAPAPTPYQVVQTYATSVALPAGMPAQ